MKYQNAGGILPDELLREIQKYASGQLLYIPKPEHLHCKWGEDSGSRRYLAQRNEEIRRRFSLGDPIEALAEIFCLSCDSIRKIVYAKNK